MAAPSWHRYAVLYTRLALGASFLSGVADRFGLWPRRYEGYGDWAGFVRYTAKVNAFAPPAIVPLLAWAATAAELGLGVGLIVGYRLRWVSLGSVALLLLFGVAMAISFGPKSPWTIRSSRHRRPPCSSRCATSRSRD